MQSKNLDIVIAIVLGLLVGSANGILITLLRLVEIQQVQLNHQTWPLHIFFIPVVLLLLLLIRRRFLYFPTSVAEVLSWNSTSCLAWSPWMAPLNFIGAIFSHLVGASVGREGVGILVASGMVRLGRLSWSYWSPIAISCGFSSVIGSPLIGLVFMTEIFTSQLRQKILLLVAAITAGLWMQFWKIEHAPLVSLSNLPSFSEMQTAFSVNRNAGFWKTLGFLLLLGIGSGFIMRFYKAIYFFLVSYFAKRSVITKISLSLLLMFFFLAPSFRTYQSLGLLQIHELFRPVNSLMPQSFEFSLSNLSFEGAFLKLIATVLSLSLGFWGGEFIPMVYAGIHFGGAMSQHLSYSPPLGVYFASYLFFAGATRAKWTSVFLLVSVMGWSFIGWVLFLVNVCVGFSGEKSIYKK